MTLAGTTNYALSATFSPASGYSGAWTFGNRQSIQFDQIEKLTPTADLTVSQTASANPTEGGNVVWTITVVNNGPSAAPNVILTDLIPAGTTFVSSTFAGYSASTNQINLGTIAAGARVTGTIVIHTPEEGTVSNTASVRSDLPDITPADDTSTLPVVVADPQIAASGGFTVTAVIDLDSGVQTVATFTDPGGPGDTDYVATINWGDGQTDTATLANGGIVDLGTAGGVEMFAVRGRHVFGAAGTSPLVVTIQHATLTPLTVVSASSVSAELLIHGTPGNDTLVVMRTPGGGVGAITYILNGGPPVVLPDVQSFEFDGDGGADSMTVLFGNGAPLVNGAVTFDGGAGGGTLTIGAAGLPVRTVPGSFTVGNGQVVAYSGVGTTNIDAAGGVHASAAPDTADRAAAFVGLTPDERFIQALYLADLGRAGARSELDGWVATLAAYRAGAVGAVVGAGGSEQLIAGAIAHSHEANTRVVQSWYLTYLGRVAQGGEEQGWVNLLQGGFSQESVLSLILGTAEFYARARPWSPPGAPTSATSRRCTCCCSTGPATRRA